MEQPQFFAQILFPLAFSLVQFSPIVLVILWFFHFKNFIVCEDTVPDLSSAFLSSLNSL